MLDIILKSLPKATVLCAVLEERKEKKKHNTHVKVENKFCVINGLLVNGDLNQILL